MKKIFAALVLSASMSPVVNAQQADKATVLILDASGSMWGQLSEGRTKIEVARDVLGGFFSSRDATVPLGIIAYGHNRKGDCSDIEVLAPVGPTDTASMSARLNQLNPKGKTPLGQSLRMAAGLIPRTSEEADIVLVTDGLETCDVDPCAVADELVGEGIKIRAHVVGFGLKPEEAEALSCVPEKTGGLLLTPQSGQELAEALVRTTAPVPQVSGPSLTFFEGDNFNGQSFAVPGDTPNFDSIPFEPGLDGDANDSAFSARVKGRWLICTDADYQGKCRVVETDLPTLGDFNGSVSSARYLADEPEPVKPKAGMTNHGPYALGTAWIDLGVSAEGSETGGAALALRLYPLKGGDSITYSTVEGTLGAKSAAINLDQPGRFILRLETWGGEVLDEMEIEAQPDPEVTISIPKVTYAPGAPVEVSSRGSQLLGDRIEIWRGDERIDWGFTLGELAEGKQIVAPNEPNDYDLVYTGYDSSGEIVEKARVYLPVGVGFEESPNLQKTEAGDGDGHGPDDGADGKPWEDYAFTCLGEQNCELRDEETGLFFFLPAGWVADQPSNAPMTAGQAASGAPLSNPYVEFWQAGGNLHHIILNPHQWIDDNGPCVITRAGQLCLWRNDSAPDDPAAYKALETLQTWMTTGHVIRRCGDEDCDFSHPNPPISGKMPALWSVEAARPLPDGRLSTWFFDRDRAGNFKLMGLNQPNGENCLEIQPGDEICEFTPYISTREAELIRANLKANGTAKTLSKTMTADQVLDLLAPSRIPAPSLD
ncbi:VWA domain-containing protein [Rhizobium sp. L1K21]|uniref:VWA domain-containing protein n=1 Tax=Rhizobium sp. L1K21 TaxID=2954933 RepID=UPI0020932912|nr:VWA domain-containing protein [Rhizobium sp. L1K21]MCO6187043.1 VWA domain-containing protein [Rhizobium sp. L1K21]